MGNSKAWGLRRVLFGTLLGMLATTFHFTWEVNWQKADLSNADLRGLTFRHSNFRDANVRSADLSGCDLRHSDFSGANLQDANLTNAQVGAAVFDNALGLCFQNDRCYGASRACNCGLLTNPTRPATGRPLRNEIRAGIELTPYLAAKLGLSSMFTFTIFTCGVSRANSSNVGLSIRHGPHQSA